MSIKNSYFRPQIALTTPTEATKVVLHERDDCYQIDFSDSFHIQIPLSNPLLFKSLALCLLNNQMINRRQAAQSLQLSEDRVGKLAKKLTEEDVVQDEWSKDNDIRMISTDMLRAWGKEIRTAAKKEKADLTIALHKLDNEVTTILQSAELTDLNHEKSSHKKDLQHGTPGDH